MSNKRFLRGIGQADAAVANTVERPADKLINETTRQLIQAIASDAGNNEETIRSILESLYRKAVNQ